MNRRRIFVLARDNTSLTDILMTSPLELKHGCRGRCWDPRLGNDGQRQRRLRRLSTCCSEPSSAWISDSPITTYSHYIYVNKSNYQLNSVHSLYTRDNILFCRLFKNVVPFIKDVIQEKSINHHDKLENHSNSILQPLLEQQQRRLKKLWPADLIDGWRRFTHWKGTSSWHNRHRRTVSKPAQTIIIPYCNHYWNNSKEED
jgi:hypothetical protein